MDDGPVESTSWSLKHLSFDPLSFDSMSFDPMSVIQLTPLCALCKSCSHISSIFRGDSLVITLYMSITRGSFLQESKEGGSAEIKKCIREELRRWHPDKFKQEYLLHIFFSLCIVSSHSLSKLLNSLLKPSCSLLKPSRSLLKPSRCL